MSDSRDFAPVPPPPAYGVSAAPASYPPPPGVQLAAGYLPAQYTTGPLGKIRGTGSCILLSIVTLGIYGMYWNYKVYSEMKDHSGTGLGGGVALLLSFFVGIVMPFVTSAEVGGLYERRGQAKPVSGATGLWCIPGMLILVGPLIWFVKTNGALNSYWRSLGAI